MSTVGQRMAAARLAMLARQDRAWVLSRLAVEERRVLARLLKSPRLQELSSMGAVDEAALRIEEAIDTTAVVDGPNPIVAATADALSPEWASLWLSQAHPSLIDAYAGSQATARARRLQVARDTQLAVPPGLAGALANFSSEGVA